MLVIALLAFSAGWLFGTRDLNVVHAQEANRQYAIGKSWGELKGSTGSFLLFEDDQGAVRVVNMTQSHPVSGLLTVQTILRRK